MKIFKLLSVRFQYWILVITTALIIIILGIGIQHFFRDNKESATSSKITAQSDSSSKKQEEKFDQSHLQISRVPISQMYPASTLQVPKLKRFPINENNKFPLNNSIINTPPLVNTPSLPLDQDGSVQKSEEYFNSENETQTSSIKKFFPSNHSSIKQELGHFAYSEDIQQNLVKVGNYYNRIALLDYEAAKAFKLMQSAAKNDGIDLIIISGFRSILDQKQLFKKQIERRGSREEAAKLSAPPGFSEHHTGFAMDIGDGQQPDSDLKFSFERTSAYSWLLQNAHVYGFELSFPPNNTQGVSFEPWHWRYVISERANQYFYQARKIN